MHCDELHYPFSLMLSLPNVPPHGRWMCIWWQWKNRCRDGATEPDGMPQNLQSYICAATCADGMKSPQNFPSDDGKPLPPDAAAIGKDGATRGRLHAFAKPAAPLTNNLRWIITWFHSLTSRTSLIISMAKAVMQEVFLKNLEPNSSAEVSLGSYSFAFGQLLQKKTNLPLQLFCTKLPFPISQWHSRSI